MILVFSSRSLLYTWLSLGFSPIWKFTFILFLNLSAFSLRWNKNKIFLRIYNFVFVDFQNFTKIRIFWELLVILRILNLPRGRVRLLKTNGQTDAKTSKLLNFVKLNHINLWSLITASWIFKTYINESIQWDPYYSGRGRWN